MRPNDRPVFDRHDHGPSYTPWIDKPTLRLDDAGRFAARKHIAQGPVARYTIARLVKEKMLQAVGKTAGRRYYLPGEAPRTEKAAAPPAASSKPAAAPPSPEMKHLERMLSPDAAGVAALEAKIMQLRHELRGLEGALAIIRGEAA